jgi:hypothetical protein
MGHYGPLGTLYPLIYFILQLDALLLLISTNLPMLKMGESVGTSLSRLRYLLFRTAISYVTVT